MSDKDGTLSLKIGFHIDKAELDKLIYDAVDRFKRKFAIGVYSTVDGVNMGKIKKSKGLSDHTDASSTVIHDISKDVKTILGILQSRTGASTITPTTIFPPGVFSPPTTKQEHPSRPLVSELVKLKTKEKRTIEATKKHSLLMDTLCASFEEQKDKIKDKAVSKAAEKDRGKDELILEWNKTRLEKYREKHISRIYRDPKHAVTQAPPYEYYNIKHQKWMSSPVEGQIPLADEDKSPQEIIMELTELGDSDELRKFMTTSTAKGVLDKMKHVLVTVSEAGNIHINLVAEISSRATRQLSVLKKMSDMLRDSLIDVKIRDAESALTFGPEMYEMVMRGATGHRDMSWMNKVIKDKVNLIKKLRVTSLSTGIIMGGGYTGAKDDLNDFTQMRHRMRSKSYIMEEERKGGTEHRRDVGITMKAATQKAERVLETMPGKKGQELSHKEIGEHKRFVVDRFMKHKLVTGTTEVENILSMENEYGRIRREILGLKSLDLGETTPSLFDTGIGLGTLDFEHKEFMDAEDKLYDAFVESEKVGKIFKKQKHLIGASHGISLIESMVSKVSARKAADAEEHRSLKNEIDRNLPSAEELKIRRKWEKQRTAIARSGKIPDSWSVGEIQKEIVAYTRSLSSGRNTAMHISSRIDVLPGEGYPTEKPVLNFDLLGSPFKTSIKHVPKGTEAELLEKSVWDEYSEDEIAVNAREKIRRFDDDKKGKWFRGTREDYKEENEQEQEKETKVLKEKDITGLSEDAVREKMVEGGHVTPEGRITNVDAGLIVELILRYGDKMDDFLDGIATLIAQTSTDIGGVSKRQLGGKIK